MAQAQHIQPNCFNVDHQGYMGPGFLVEKDQGKLCVMVGGYKCYNNYFTPFEVVKEGLATVVHQACMPQTGTPSGVPVYTLAKPTDAVVALVKVNLVLPPELDVAIDNHRLYLFSGVERAVVAQKAEALVQLFEGEDANFFFADGTVRKFVFSDGSLNEVLLSSAEMVDARIKNSWDKIRSSEAKSDKVFTAILSSMADLLVWTTLAPQSAKGHELRMTILRDFFLRLLPEDLSLVHAKLLAILYRYDAGLVSVLYGDEPHEVVAADAEQRKSLKAQAAQKKAAKAELDRQERLAMKGTSQGTGKQKCSNPKELARRNKKAKARK